MVGRRVAILIACLGLLSAHQALAAGDTFFTAQCRVMDTRISMGGPILGAGEKRLLTLTGSCGIPSDALAVAVNIVVVRPAAAGFAVLFAGDAPTPATSVLNFQPNQVRANNAIVALAGNGSGTIALVNGSFGTADYVIDISGYFKTGCPTITIAPAGPALPTGTEGASYSQTFTASGGTGSYAFLVASGSLPPGLNLPLSGVLSGTPTVAGDFSFTVGASDLVTFCTGSNAYTLHINCGTLTVNITPTPAQVCAGSSGNSASATAGFATYSWTITNGTIQGSATGQTISYTAGASGNVGLTVNVTDASACPGQGTQNVPITANPAPPTIATSNPQTFTVSGASGTFTLTFNGQTTSSLAFNATAAQVQTALNALSSIAGVGGSTAVTQVGNVYTVTFGGSLTGPQPQMTASGAGGATVVVSSPSVCADSTGNQARGPAGATSYAWTIGNGTITSAANIQTITYTAGSSGSVTLNLTITNPGGCSASNSVLVAINPAPSTPTITPTPAQVCGGSTGNTASGPAGATTYAWTIGNGTITSAANIQTITYTAGASGNVTLNLTVTNASGCPASNSVLVPINASPGTPSITPTPAQVCASSTGNTAAGPAGATSYAWTIANGSITSATNIQTITYTAGAAGNVTLNLTVTNAAACAASNSVLVPINANPAPPTIINSGPQMVTVTGGAGTFTLTFNGQTTSSLAFNATAAQVQTALNALSSIAGVGGSVTVNLAGGVYSVLFGGTLTGPRPLMTASGAGGATVAVSPTACADSTGNQASGPAGATTYAWTIGNGAITSATNVQTITYTAGSSGTVTLSLTVTNAAACSASNSLLVTINPTPATPTITPTPASVCALSTGNTADGPAGATTYAWTITNGTITSATNIQTITYTAGASGNVTLGLTVTNASNCSASNSLNVTINPAPATPTITPTPAQVCSGSTGNTASGPAGATTYAWSITNGTITSATNLQTITYTAGVAAGNVGLTLVVTNAQGCSASNTVNVTKNATPAFTPAAGALSVATFNVAYPLTFAGTGGTAPYTFVLASGALPGGMTLNSNGTVTPNTPSVTGPFAFSITVTDAKGCSATQAYTLNVQPNLTAKAYTDVGNTQLSGGIAVATPAVSVVAVSNGDTSDTTITYAVTVAPTHGTLTTFNTNGSFLYTPNVGNTTADAFTYTGTSNGVSATKTATIAFSGMVWYVDNATASGINDGRSNTPFKTMTAVNGAATNNGDFIYVAKGSGTTTGAYTMKPSQQLIGAGATLNVPTVGPILTVVGNAANAPTLGGTVTLANSVTVNGIDMSTGASNAIAGAGVTSISVTARNISTTTGTAINLTGAGNTGTMTFTSVSSNGGSNGIFLQNFSGGSFTVTGTIGSTSNDGSGGTIQNMTGGDASPVETATVGNGIYLNGVSNVSLNHMNLHDFSNYGIIGTNVTGFTMTYSTMSGANGTNQGGVGEGDVYFTGLSGSATVDNSTFSGAAYDTFHVFNSGQTLNRITITNSSFGSLNTGSNDALVFQATGGTLNVTVQKSTFTAARGDLVQINLLGTVTSDLVFGGGAGLGNTLTNNNSNIVSGGGGVTLGGGGPGQVDTFTFNISNNTFRDALGSAIAIGAGTGAGTNHNYSGTISNNVIGVAGIANSGSGQGSGVAFIFNDAGTGTVTISGNQIYQYNGVGIGFTFGAFGSSNPYLNATVTGNTISNPGTFGSQGVLLTAGTQLSPLDHGRVCLTLTGNSMTGSGGNGATDIRIRDRFDVKVGLPGYAGASTDTAATQTFLSGNNGGASSSASAPASGTTNGTTNGYFGVCPP